MEKERFSVHITVGLILLKDNKVLMMRRCNTGYMDGYYALVSGHVEAGESLKQATVREAFEEVGITIKKEDLEFVCLHHKPDAYINFFLKAEHFEGTPFIKEPDKCNELIWVDIHHIPEHTILADKRSIENMLNQTVLDEYQF